MMSETAAATTAVAAAAGGEPNATTSPATGTPTTTSPTTGSPTKTPTGSVRNRIMIIERAAAAGGEPSATPTTGTPTSSPSASPTETPPTTAIPTRLAGGEPTAETAAASATVYKNVVFKGLEGELELSDEMVVFRTTTACHQWKWREFSKHSKHGKKALVKLSSRQDSTKCVIFRLSSLLEQDKFRDDISNRLLMGCDRRVPLPVTVSEEPKEKEEANNTSIDISNQPRQKDAPEEESRCINRNKPAENAAGNEPEEEEEEEEDIPLEKEASGPSPNAFAGEDHKVLVAGNKTKRGVLLVQENAAGIESEEEEGPALIDISMETEASDAFAGEDPNPYKVLVAGNKKAAGNEPEKEEEPKSTAPIDIPVKKEASGPPNAFAGDPYKVLVAGNKTKRGVLLVQALVLFVLVEGILAFRVAVDHGIFPFYWGQFKDLVFPVVDRGNSTTLEGCTEEVLPEGKDWWKTSSQLFCSSNEVEEEQYKEREEDSNDKEESTAMCWLGGEDFCAPDITLDENDPKCWHGFCFGFHGELVEWVLE